MPSINAINLSNLPTTHPKTTMTTSKPAVANQTHVPATVKAPLSAAPQASNNLAGASTKQRPYVASKIDDFLASGVQLQSPHERNISTSSAEENDDNYEPYTRRDFRIDVKPSDKISNDTSSGYFTSPNENDKSLSRAQNVFSPDSDYEKFNIVQGREENSSSPADSQSGRSASSHCRKSVSFDLDVEEYTPDYTPIDDEEEAVRQNEEENVFYEKSVYHHQQLQPEPKRIKGILRSPSPSVFYKGNVSKGAVVESEYIDDEDADTDEAAGGGNPFRKEYLSQERLYEPSSAQGFDIDQLIRQSSESLNKQSKIPIMKPIFKSTGSLVDRPKIPPPRPPQPNIKVAAVVSNDGLKRMSQHMEEGDFLEFVHNAETNTIEEVKGRELFDPDDPLPPLPKCPPPPLHFKRGNSFDRPKNSPPPPPTPKSPKLGEEIIEILPARFESFPSKQKPHFVNENSQNNILVTEEEHREILLTENEVRNAMLNEYDDKKFTNDDTKMLIAPFSPTNPFLDESSSFDSFQSTPNVLSPVSTLDKSGSSFGQYIPSYQPDAQHVQPLNILPPPAQVLPVHYGHLPKPQQTGYYPIMTHQYPMPYNAPSSTGASYPSPQQTPPNYAQQISNSYSVDLQQQQLVQQQRTAYLVSGDGQNNFYVTPNVNNTTASNLQQHQTLLMQSAYGPLSQPSPPPNQASMHPLSMHMQAPQTQFVATGTQPSHNQPQFIYEQQQLHQPQFYQQTSLRNNNIQYVENRQTSISELSPIRINAVPQNFIYPANGQGEQKPSMSSFGKQTEV